MSNEMSILNPNLNDIISNKIEKNDIIELVKSEMENKILLSIKTTEIEIESYQKELNIIHNNLTSYFDIKCKLFNEAIKVIDNSVYSYTGHNLKEYNFGVFNETTKNYDSWIKISLSNEDKKMIMKVSNEMLDFETIHIDPLRIKLNSYKNDLKNLPKKIVEFSTGFTRKALESTIQGQDILSIINGIQTQVGLI